MKYLIFEAHTCIAQKWYFYQFMLQEKNYVKLRKLYSSQPKKIRDISKINAVKLVTIQNLT